LGHDSLDQFAETFAGADLLPPLGGVLGRLFALLDFQKTSGTTGRIRMAKPSAGDAVFVPNVPRVVMVLLVLRLDYS